MKARLRTRWLCLLWGVPYPARMDELREIRQWEWYLAELRPGRRAIERFGLRRERKRIQRRERRRVERLRGQRAER